MLGSAHHDAAPHAGPRQTRRARARLQSIAALEAQLERQDVRGTALRAAIARLQEYAKDANEKAATADRELLDLDRELTILKANVSGAQHRCAAVVSHRRVQRSAQGRR